MNCIWNKNLALFKKRFPTLAEQLRIKNEELKIEGVPASPSGFLRAHSLPFGSHDSRASLLRSASLHSATANAAPTIPNAGSETKQAEAKLEDKFLTESAENLRWLSLSKPPLEILPSKLKIPGTNDFYPTARENGKFLHSSYNPLREAEQAAKTIHSSIPDIYGAAFFGCGLGYEVLAYARLFPSDTIIVVESDARYFFTALSVLDWSDFFNAKNIVLLLETQPGQVISLIEKCGGFSHIKIYENKAQTFHAENYFSTLNSLVERNRQKSKINSSTLEKFSSLWLKNSCRNLHFLAEKDGVKIYENHLKPEIPALILAAGPTLQEILPHLQKLQKRTIIIAVDTALRACLKANVQPDFVILCDPQYYAFRHIAGLHSPKSVLITESAAYPAVFRFDCRKIVMCSSMFPLGKFVESKLGTKGNLCAGGSVSTTAWDFARLIGAKKIIFSGLDLGYPGLETHIKGSTFEEKIHAVSNRLTTAEKSGIASLFAAGIQKSTDYNGNKILTDSKMKMFAWWFESKQEEFSSQIQSFSLSPKSLKIPGFKVLGVNEILNLPDFTSEKNEFFEKSEGVPLRFASGRAIRTSANRSIPALHDVPLRNACGGATIPNASTGSKPKQEENFLTEFSRWLSTVETTNGAKPTQDSTRIHTDSHGFPRIESEAKREEAKQKEKFPTERTEFTESFSEKSREKQNFSAVLSSIQSGLSELYSLADAAEKISDAAVLSHDAQKRNGFSMQLASIDSKIANSEFKEIASLVFPTESQLSKIFQEKIFSPDELTANFQRSKIVYELVKQSVRKYQKAIFYS